MHTLELCPFERAAAPVCQAPGLKFWRALVDSLPGLPGAAVVGVLGGGQLGKMLALDAVRLCSLQDALTGSPWL